MDNLKITVSRKKIKHLYIRVVSPSEIMVTCGKRFSMKEIDEFIRLKADWIERQRQKLAQNNQAENLSVEEGSQLVLADRSYRITLRLSDKNTLRESDGTLYMTLTDINNEEMKRRLLLNWYKRAFAVYASQRLQQLMTENAHLGISAPAKLSVKDTSTRWGSYSAKTKTISLCIRLGAYGTQAIDSVIFHELAHTVHMNHQQGFYDLLYKMMPDYPAAHKLLKNKKNNQNWYLV